ncbi:MAG: hypothetical protein JSU86_19710 [Phycisphaerales bacterium]|nr:MAG: hypothetical protein JSU86_19710 [Phycisphaerales bacterium]
MISADMVAYNYGDDLARIYGRSSSDPHKNALAQAVTLYGDGLSYFLGGERDLTDHAPFEWVGFQACHLREDFGNPYYHTYEDSVDTPGYIDYAYATRMTRSVVGFLVDNAGVNVDIPDADYDGDGDVDLDDFDVLSTCYSGSGNPPDTGCEFFDFDGDNDVDCDDWRVFEVLWTEPGDPPTFSLCVCFPSSPAQPETLALAGDPVSQKVRYLSFSAGDAGRSQAVRISFKNLPPAYHTWDDVEMWVQAPTTYCEHSAQKKPPDCPPAEPRIEWTGATLGCDPWFGDFYSAGVIHVFHEGIIPGGTYWIEVVDATCDWVNKPWSSFSAPLVLTQSAWADLVKNCVTCPCGPPDGSTGIPTDVTAVLDKFKNLKPPDIPCAAVTKVRADLDWETPDQLINISDVTFCLDAFRGVQYPPPAFNPPSSPPCGG